MKGKTVNLALGHNCKHILLSVLSEGKLSLILFIDENRKQLFASET